MKDVFEYSIVHRRSYLLAHHTNNMPRLDTAYERFSLQINRWPWKGPFFRVPRLDVLDNRCCLQSAFSLHTILSRQERPQLHYLRQIDFVCSLAFTCLFNTLLHSFSAFHHVIVTIFNLIFGSCKLKSYVFYCWFFLICFAFQKRLYKRSLAICIRSHVVLRR